MWLNKLNTPQSFYLNILRVLKFAEINKPLYPQKISFLSSQTIATQSYIPSYWLYKCTHNISQTFWLDKPICSRIRRNMHRFFRFLSQKAHMCLSKNRNLWIINNVGKCRKRKRDTKKTKQEMPYQFWQSEQPTGISVLFQTVRSMNRRHEKTKRECFIYKCYVSRPKNVQ